jgi:hypothetical protein
MTQQDSINQGVNYSNLIKQKADHNLSFSNNLVEPDEESSSDEEIMDLQELDLNYDDNAKREFEIEQSQHSQYSQRERYDNDIQLTERGKNEGLIFNRR